MSGGPRSPVQPPNCWQSAALDLAAPIAVQLAEGLVELVLAQLLRRRTGAGATAGTTTQPADGQGLR